jgi:hypothetical protein
LFEDILLISFLMRIPLLYGYLVENGFDPSNGARQPHRYSLIAASHAAADAPEHAVSRLLVGDSHTMELETLRVL